MKALNRIRSGSGVLAVLAAAALLGSALAAAAAPEASGPGRLDPALRLLGGAGSPRGIAGTAADGRIPVLIRGRVDDAALERLGIQAGPARGSIRTAWVPRSRLADLAGIPGVEQVGGSHVLQPLMDSVRSATHVDELWQGPPPVYSPSGYTGQNVVLGIVDTGIDVNHSDFRRPDGTTRVLCLWDQTALTGPAPAPYTYGREYTADDINAGRCQAYDTNGHGTHVAGVAAGNGQATGNGYPAYRYVGMAPQADLIVVKANATGAPVTDVQVLDAVDYIFQQAGARPAVVLLAYGKQSGPHDGTDPLDVGIDERSGPGRIVVAAAGNEGLSRIHAEASAAPNQTARVSFTVPNYTLYYMEVVRIEGWFNAGTDYSITVTTPSGEVAGPIRPGQQIRAYTDAGVVDLLYMDGGSGPDEFYLSAAPDPAGAIPLGIGEWKIDARDMTGAGGATDYWLTYYSMAGGTPGMTQGQSIEKCIASPATAGRAVGVSAYTTKKYWTDVNGGPKYYISAVLDQLADFSSHGPRRDGVVKPDITASGYGVAAARSANASVSSSYVVEDGVHRMLYGTSVAAAAVAGAVAILLEEEPALDPDGVKSILQARALHDDDTGPVPNPEWGAGKLSLAAPSQTGVGDGEPRPGTLDRPVMLGAPYPNPTSGLSQIGLSLAAPAPGMDVSVYDVVGRRVRSLHRGALPAGSVTLSWDGADDAGRQVPAGSYYVVAGNEANRVSRTILIVR